MRIAGAEREVEPPIGVRHRADSFRRNDLRRVTKLYFIGLSLFGVSFVVGYVALGGIVVQVVNIKIEEPGNSGYGDYRANLMLCHLAAGVGAACFVLIIWGLLRLVDRA